MPRPEVPALALWHRLHAAIGAAHAEVRLSVPASPQGRALVGHVGESVLAATHRVVRVRAVVEARALHEPSEFAFVRDLATAGATVRVSRQLAGFAVQVDLSIAFWLVSGCSQTGVVVVRDRDALVALASVFEHEWRMSLTPELPEEWLSYPDETDLAVLSALATGAKDEVVARRLGLSVRSVRRRIAHLQEQLGAGSRFETGVRAAQRGWVTAGGQDES